MGRGQAQSTILLTLSRHEAVSLVPTVDRRQRLNVRLGKVQPSAMGFTITRRWSFQRKLAENKAVDWEGREHPIMKLGSAFRPPYHHNRASFRRWRKRERVENFENRRTRIGKLGRVRGRRHRREAHLIPAFESRQSLHTRTPGAP